MESGQRVQKTVRDILHVLIDNPKLWFADSEDDDTPSPMDEEASLSGVLCQPADGVEDSLQGGGPPNKGHLPLDATESANGRFENFEAQVVKDHCTSRSDNVLKGGESYPSGPFQIHMISRWEPTFWPTNL